MCMCRREWEESARKALSGKHSLHALSEVVASAADMGAEECPLAQHLRAKVGELKRTLQQAVAWCSKLLFGERGRLPSLHSNTALACLEI